MFGLGFQELLVIFLILILLFGAKNIPEIAKSIGKTMQAFKKGIHEAEKEVKSLTDDIKKS